MNLLAGLLLLGCLIQLVYSQQYFLPADSGLYYEAGKNHLRGIRRIPYSRYFGRDDNLDTIADSSNELGGSPQHVASPLSRQLVGEAGLDQEEGEPRRRLAPVATKPRVNMPSSVASGQRSAGVLTVDQPLAIPTQTTNRGAKRLGVEDLVEPSNPRISSEMERRRLERIQSRWRKIGPLLGGGRSSAFQRMRLVQQRRLASMGQLQPTNSSEAISSTKQTPAITALPPATPAQSQASLAAENEESTHINHRQKGIGEADHSVGGGGAFDGTFVRRQPQVKEQGPAGMQQQILKARAYSNRILKQQRLLRQRPRITGPVLAPKPVPETQEQQPQPSNRNKQLQLAAKTSAVDNGPTIYQNHISAEEVETVQEDYHHRKGMTVEKRFKLVPNKVSYRPRLKIRRPGEQFVAAARGETNSKSSPITLPHLTPFQPKDQSSQSGWKVNFLDRRMQPEGPPSTGHLHHRQHIGTNREVLPLTDSSEQPETPTSSSTNKKLRLPIATKWSSQEEGAEEGLLQPAGSGLPNPGVLINSGSSIRQPIPPAPTPPPSTPPPTDPPAEWGSIGEQPPWQLPKTASHPTQHTEIIQTPTPSSGDSALAFGGDIGTPPPGFKEAFGLNGDETSLVGSSTVTTANTLNTSPTASEAQKTMTPTKETPATTPPSPIQEASATTISPQPIVIPENSGLRPVAPPREFKGGFGSSGGGSGFGGGGGGSSPRLPIQQPPVQVEPPPPPSPSRGGPVEPAPSEGLAENVFTGESAFLPNRLGPTGDGYGPPVFPGPGAVPPAVPAVNFGGAAAGIPPYRNGGGPSSAEEIKNEATTVKPSALLSILNKADEGFNQVINHFEQGTPLESTAIDVLEVALGSQKLDSQAKLLSHVDRTIGLDNIQRLQRWANTGGALDLLKEQFVKIAKNYKPPPETKAITIPPQLEYLFQSGSG